IRSTGFMAFPPPWEFSLICRRRAPPREFPFPRLFARSEQRWYPTGRLRHHNDGRPRMMDRGYRWKGTALSALVFALVLAGLSGCVSAMPTGSPAISNVDVDPWPRQLTSGDHTYSVFQPQYERWDQGRLTGRAAVVVENPVSPEPQYGVIRFTARTEVDKETRIVTLEDVTIAKADFPTAPGGGAVYLAALRQALSAQPLT